MRCYPDQQIFEPRHEISNNVVCATSKGSDQPAHTRSLIRAFALSLEYSITLKLLTEYDLEFQSLKGGCRGSSESTLVNMPHCWKSHVAAHLMTGCFTLIFLMSGGFSFSLSVRRYVV